MATESVVTGVSVSILKVKTHVSGFSFHGSIVKVKLVYCATN